MRNILKFQKRAILRQFILRFIAEVFGLFFLWYSGTHFNDIFGLGRFSVVGFLLLALIAVGEVVNLTISYWRGFEAAVFNENRDGLLIRTGLFQRRPMLLALEAIQISKTDTGVVVNYSRGLYLQANGRVVAVDGGVFVWRSKDFAPYALTDFANQITLAQNAQPFPMEQDASPQTNQTKKTARKKKTSKPFAWTPKTITLFSSIGVVGFVTLLVIGLANSSDQSNSTESSSKKSGDSDSFLYQDYKPGVLLKTDDYKFTLNKGYLAWNTNNDRVAIFNVTAVSRKSGDNMAELESRNFAAMSNFNMTSAKNSDYYSDDVDPTNIKKDGQTVQVVNALTEDMEPDYHAPSGTSETFNLVVKVPETGKSFDLYYEGFPIDIRNTPKEDYDDSSFVLHVKKADLEKVNE
jgi:hypothetical protein